MCSLRSKNTSNYEYAGRFQPDALKDRWSAKVPPEQLLANYLVFMFAADHLKDFLRCPLVAKQKLQVIVRKLISLSANNVTSS